MTITDVKEVTSVVGPKVAGRLMEVMDMTIQITLHWCNGATEPWHVNRYTDTPAAVRRAGIQQWTEAVVFALDIPDNADRHVSRITYCESTDDPHYHRSMTRDISTYYHGFSCRHQVTAAMKVLKRKRAIRRNNHGKGLVKPLP